MANAEAPFRLRRPFVVAAPLAALALLAACSDYDLDLRDRGGAEFDTSAALANVPNRPRPDNRGVIAYPTYQVVVAQSGDTVRSIAGRFGLDPQGLAVYNGIDPDAPLRRDEIIALPGRVAEPSAATGAVDVTSIASAAIDRAGPQAGVTTTSLGSTNGSAATAAAPLPAQGEPIRHQVARGETAYSIARLYGVPVRGIAEWNGLGADLTVREGQFLLIPQAGALAPATGVSAPGQGSATPVPPSAAAPLPENDTPAGPAAPPAPDLGDAAPRDGDAPLVYPVQGPIIRAYAPGRNEGIDIGAAAGTDVRAAAAGTVAAVTTDTNGIAIVVIKHADNLLTVYTNLDGLRVAKDDPVSQGQVIARVRAGSPSFLHFEVRDGMASVDPTLYLP